MKRTLTYVILGTALLLSNRLFVSSGWAAETDVISFASRKGGNFTLHFTNTRGEILRHITFKTPSMYGHTWSPSGKWIAYVLTEVIGPLKPVLLPEGFEDPVVCVVNTTAGGGGKPIQATKEFTRGLVFGTSLDWVPEGFFSVSPSAEKQTTLWGRLKQADK